MTHDDMNHTLTYFSPLVQGTVCNKYDVNKTCFVATLT